MSLNVRQLIKNDTHSFYKELSSISNIIDSLYKDVTVQLNVLYKLKSIKTDISTEHHKAAILSKYSSILEQMNIDTSCSKESITSSMEGFITDVENHGLLEAIFKLIDRIVDYYHSFMDTNLDYQRKLKGYVSGILRDVAAIDDDEFNSLRATCIDHSEFKEFTRTMSSINFDTLIKNGEQDFSKAIDSKVANALSLFGYNITKEGPEKIGSFTMERDFIATRDWTPISVKQSVQDLIIALNHVRVSSTAAVNQLERHKDEIDDVSAVYLEALRMKLSYTIRINYTINAACLVAVERISSICDHLKLRNKV